jgi:hypothetical protein
MGARWGADSYPSFVDWKDWRFSAKNGEKRKKSGWVGKSSKNWKKWRLGGSCLEKNIIVEKSAQE